MARSVFVLTAFLLMVHHIVETARPHMTTGHTIEASADPPPPSPAQAREAECNARFEVAKKNEARVIETDWECWMYCCEHEIGSRGRCDDPKIRYRPFPCNNTVPSTYDGNGQCWFEKTFEYEEGLLCGSHSACSCQK
eukprot:gnl/TRDRNA2_/TRDRNA2_192352_c0_seq1.p2 gnl/TRDRNA2_/TRDRNA2_192352_c0~~gnl/TRDRNA2_/TRDRNA2_192352_c0_seq1.p2  ORF type:complete len:138 (-),score=4.03 gnl/TRDRNA2_/TRDRNA2_192352_c0_seq1:149-562(-)